MGATTFVDKSTVINTPWLNDVNGVVWTLFNGATTPTAGRTALGLGTMATQNASAVAITGGTISGLGSPLPVASGGTGVTTSTGTGNVVLSNSPSIQDNAFLINASDTSKRIQFSLNNLTTATTRTVTIPDSNIILADRALTQAYAPASGTNTYVAGFGPQLSAYVTDGIYFIKFANANTVTNPTLNIDTRGPVTIVRQGGSSLYVGDITANMYAQLQYNGTQFVLLNPAVNVATKFVSSDQTITSGTQRIIPHGLPGTPTKLWYGLVNVTTQYGWTTGQILYQSFGPQDNSGAVARGATARADATNIYIRYGSAADVFVVHQETGTPGLTSAATNLNWQLRVYAEL